MDKKIKILFKVLGVVLALYLFLVGIKGLSSGIKMLGGDFANQIMTNTSNPFISLLVGILATTLYDHLKFNYEILITTDDRGFKYVDKENYQVNITDLEENITQYFLLNFTYKEEFISKQLFVNFFQLNC